MPVTSHIHPVLHSKRKQHCVLCVLIPDYKREKMVAPTKKPTTTTMRYRIAPDRGVYPLMEKALMENRCINKYTDRYCTTPTYAMRCLCDDCDLTEVRVQISLFL